MSTMLRFAEKQENLTEEKDLQLSPEVKIGEEESQKNINFQETSRFQLLNVEKKENYSKNIESSTGASYTNSIPPNDSSKTLPKKANRTQENISQIVEEKSTQKVLLFQSQKDQYLSNSWLLLRHPNSLFKTLKPISIILPKKQQQLLSFQKNQSSEKFHPIVMTTDQKLAEIRCLNSVKIPKVQYKTKFIQKSENFKHRKGKNQQPLAQKLIKKLSGFHYNKNYKQNRNKTLKKLAKRGLAINLQNFTTYIGKLKLEINKKFTKPDMKVKRNAKGEQIDPKKFYDLYHSYFSFQKEREFVEKFYNQTFKRVYVIMWKSDQRLKRVENIKIEGVHYNVETEPSCEIKIEPKEMSSEKQPVTQSRPEDKRAAFVQCLDEEGKLQLQEVFHQEFNKLYDQFDWTTKDVEFVKPEKEFFMKQIQRFSWLDD